MNQSNFVHLHVHSHYSLLDATTTVKSIVDAAINNQMPAIAITDNGNMFGVYEFYKYAKQKGIKPIIGYMAYLTEGSLHIKEKSRIPLSKILLIAKNNNGYKNLVKLSTIAYTKGFFYKPRIDIETLKCHSNGLIGIEAFQTGKISRYLTDNQSIAAAKTLVEYQKIFGKGNFYLEINPPVNKSEQKITESIIEFSKQHDAFVVATNPIRYIHPEDWEAHDALICMTTNSKINETLRYKLPSQEYYFKSTKEMLKHFKQYPEAISNTKIIADKCNLDIGLPEYRLPLLSKNLEINPHRQLVELCNVGLNKYHCSKKIPEEINKRLEDELATIRKLNLHNYFLVIYDLIINLRKNAAVVKTKGSYISASLVAYLIGITETEPDTNLPALECYFEADKVIFPDVEVYFKYTFEQDDLVYFLIEKLGPEHVFEISKFNHFTAKASLKILANLLDVPANEYEKITKYIDKKAARKNLSKLIATIPELKKICQNGTNSQKKLLSIASKIQGLVRNFNAANSEIVLSNPQINEILPLLKNKNATIITQYQKPIIKDLGLLTIKTKLLKSSVNPVN